MVDRVPRYRFGAYDSEPVTDFALFRCKISDVLNLENSLEIHPSNIKYSIKIEYICDLARRNPQKVAEPQFKIQPIFDQWDVIPPSWVFY